MLHQASRKRLPMRGAEARIVPKSGTKVAGRKYRSSRVTDRPGRINAKAGKPGRPEGNIPPGSATAARANQGMMRKEELRHCQQ